MDGRSLKKPVTIKHHGEGAISESEYKVPVQVAAQRTPGESYYTDPETARQMSDESRRSLEGREVFVWDGMTLGELAKELGVKPVFIMKKLMERGIFAKLDQTLDIQPAFQIVHDFGLSAIIRPD
jgi:hypothetical protein